MASASPASGRTAAGLAARLALAAAALAVAAGLAAIPAAIPSAAAPAGKAGPSLRSAAIGAAGGAAGNSRFTARGTLGQPHPVGPGAGQTHALVAGFWSAFQRTAWLADADAPTPLQNLLLQNHPNPFNPRTRITYSVARSAPVRIVVYDLRGARVATLVRETQEPGWYTVAWEGRDDAGRAVAAGLYFCHLRIGDFESVKKMLMIK
jgi:hypothetical protein